MPQDGNRGSRTPLQDYLNNDEDARLQRQLAALSSLPHSKLNEAHASKPMSTSNAGTSLLVSSRDYTLDSSNLSHDLPALSKEASSRSSTDSINTSVGADLVEGYPLLDEHDDGVLVIPTPPTTSVLQCPFNFLQCCLTFTTFEAWFLHSLTHFRDQNPPTNTKCCFCEETFENLDGRVCWEQRMAHIVLHHRQGHNLAHARPNFQLINHLFSKKLISNAEYKILRGGGDRSSDHTSQRPTEDSSYDHGTTSTATPYTFTSSSSRDRRQR